MSVLFSQWGPVHRPVVRPQGATVYRDVERAGGAFVLPDARDADVSADLGVEAEYLLRCTGDTGPSAEAHGVLMIVAFNVPEDRIAAVDEWYEHEHIDMLMRADGWLRARRHRVDAVLHGRPWTHIALHELRDVSVMESPERAAARSTPWRARLETEAWFPAAGRWIYEREMT